MKSLCCSYFNIINVFDIIFYRFFSPVQKPAPNYILFTWSTNVTLLIRLRCQLGVLIALKRKLTARLVGIFSDMLLLIFSTQMNNWIFPSVLCFASVSVLEIRSVPLILGAANLLLALADKPSLVQCLNNWWIIRK